MLRTDLSEALKNMRKMNGYHISDASARLGVTDDYLRSVEAGVLEPSVYELIDLAELYDTNFSTLKLLREDTDELGWFMRLLRRITLWMSRRGAKDTHKQK